MTMARIFPPIPRQLRKGIETFSTRNLVQVSSGEA
jgi:hypothetical protein